jgi:flavin-dependent dehydrogenase
VKKTSFDVAIIGGGPAGAATAISLRQHAPALSVLLIEASRYDTHRIGETLPPPTRSLLEHLHLWKDFGNLGAREVHATSAIWGAAKPVSNEFFLAPANIGWHVERAAFDAMLAHAAGACGAELRRGSAVRSMQWSGRDWKLSLADGSMVGARFIVDATGGSAVFARRLGARITAVDRLIGITKFFQSSSPEPGVLVEAFEHGWWYTAGLPNGKRITGCITDADLARRMRLGDSEEWWRRLAATSHVRTFTAGSEPCSPLIIRSTATQLLKPLVTEHWLAVGDAAARFDPLSSQGILKALRSGIFASYAIGDWLTRADDAGLRRYGRFVNEEFKSYCAIREKYYREEQRWPESEFWARRHQPLRESEAA